MINTPRGLGIGALKVLELSAIGITYFLRNEAVSEWRQALLPTS